MSIKIKAFLISNLIVQLVMVLFTLATSYVVNVNVFPYFYPELAFAIFIIGAFTTASFEVIKHLTNKYFKEQGDLE